MYIKLDTEFISNELPGDLTRDAEGNERAPTDAEMVETGWYRFTIEPQPAIGPGERATYTRTTSGADCVQSWTVVPLTAQHAQALRADAIAAKWQAIKAERDRRKASGIKAGGNWFHSDADSRIQQLALFVMGAGVPAVPWKTLSGSFVTMTPMLAGQIFQGTASSDMALFGAAEAHLAALQASADPSAYSFAAGWPAAYGDTA